MRNATLLCLGDLFFTLKEYWIDKNYGIENDCENIPVSQGTNNDGLGYESTRYSTIQALISFLQPKSDDVLVDYGCGKGRIVCMFARLELANSIGIELDPRLAKIAISNLDRLKGKVSKAQILVTDAIDFQPDGGTIFFIFNSFGAVTLECVLNQIRKSIAEQPRRIRLVYLNPCHEATLQKHPWLVKETEFRDLWPKTLIWRNCEFLPTT